MKKVLSIIVLFMALHASLHAQPTLSSVNPAIADPGTTVIISGTNFNAAPLNNIVRFGAVKATIAAGSTTSLTVTVPTGATYEPVSVTDATTYLTGYSPHAFTPTFSGTNAVGPGTYAAGADFVSDTGTFGNKVMAISDIDGDGKPDMLSLNIASREFNILRNQATVGSINNSSFAPSVSFASPSTAMFGFPITFVVGDLNGDAKPDLVLSVVNELYVYMNTAIPGSINTSSFAAPILFSTTGSMMSMDIADVDNDGRPELVAIDGSQVRVFKNLSSGGVLNNSSFAPAIVFSTGYGPSQLTIEDIDGDNKPEIITVNNGDTTLSILKNTGTTGIINSSSFAAPVSFATGTNPYGVAAGDIDGDGKSEIISVNYGVNTISVYRNTATAGTINASSLAAPVDYATANTPVCVVLGDMDGDNKADVVVGNILAFEVSVFHNQSTPGTINLSPKVDFSTNGFFYTCGVADMDGDEKTDIVVAVYQHSRFTVFKYGPAPPSFSPITITSVTPLSGIPGSTVIITGTNFSSLIGNNAVRFGTVKATITNATTTELTVEVPFGATYDFVFVTNLAIDLTAYSPQKFLPSFTPNLPFNDNVYRRHRNFQLGYRPSLMAMGDMDGDGKQDLVLGAFSQPGEAGGLYIYRNTTTTGHVDSNAFAPPVYLQVNDPWSNLALRDMDNDGRLDIITNDNSGSTKGVVIFRNNSFPAILDFDASVTLSITGADPVDAVVEDLDGDGKLDIAIAGHSPTVLSVWRNISSPGLIDATSFEPRVDLHTATSSISISPVTLQAVDFDQDGKKDLLYQISGGYGTLSFHNTASPGTIDASSFAAPVFLGTPVNKPLLTDDVDGDGKADISCSNNVSGFDVFRNISTPGTLNSSSFATAVNTIGPIGGSGDVNGDGYTDFLHAADSVAAYRGNATTPGTIPGNLFLPPVRFYNLLSGGGSNIVCDIDGDSKPEILVTQGQYKMFSVFKYGGKPAGNCTKAPAKPGTVTQYGVTKICPGEFRIYSINPVAGAENYFWEGPQGSILQSLQGNDTMKMSFNNSFIGSSALVTVKSMNSCGVSLVRTKTITKGTPPPAPGTITGLKTGVCGLTGVNYSVPGISGLTYYWSFDDVYGNVDLGYGTNAITADYLTGFSTISLSVKAENGCGLSNARKLSNIKSAPDKPAVINGPVVVCKYSAGVSYNVPAVPNAASYSWTGPVGSTISDGVVTSPGNTLTTSSNSIMVNFGVKPGNLKVRSNNACGSSGYSTLHIDTSCATPKMVSAEETNRLVVYPNPAHDQLNLVFNLPTGQAGSEQTETIELVVFDGLGRVLVKEQKTANEGSNETTIDVSSFAAGIYEMVLKGNKTNYKARFVVE